MAFVRVPGNPEPEGAEERSAEGRGGVKLRALYAPAPGGQARGSVILCNGRTEFLEKYFEVIRELQARGFAVYSMDWRGQGLSGRMLANSLKGHLDSVDDAVSDLADEVRALGAKLPKPHIVLAHSMGGGIALRALQTRRLEVDAALFSAPMWGIKSMTSGAAKFARFMRSIGAGGMFAPGVETRWRKEQFKRNVVTHDKERHARSQALVEADLRLALAGVTLGWVAAAADVIEGFTRPSALAHLRLPVVVLSAAEELLVDNASHDAVTKLLPDANHITVPGAKHEIMMETDEIRAQFWAAFDALADGVAPRRASGPAVA
jgi:lysophospholipase